MRVCEFTHASQYLKFKFETTTTKKTIYLYYPKRKKKKQLIRKRNENKNKSYVAISFPNTHIDQNSLYVKRCQFTIV